MKNVYLIETKETCTVWKQYSVEAYMMDDAERILLAGELYEQGKELDHYIESDLGINEIKNIKHVGIRGEL